jgi:hypothetical protein
MDITTIEVTGANNKQMQYVDANFSFERMDKDTVNVGVPTSEADDFTDWLDAQHLDWRLV